jgi:hypothetical protein
MLQAHAGKLLAALVGNLNDRNIIIRKNYANAIGHLMKIARPSSFQKLGEKLQTWYLDKDGQFSSISLSNHLFEPAVPYQNGFSRLRNTSWSYLWVKDLHYSRTEDEASHLICGVTVRAVYRNSPGVTSQHVNWSMPLAFFAMHGPKPIGW